MKFLSAWVVFVATLVTVQSADPPVAPSNGLTVVNKGTTGRNSQNALEKFEGEVLQLKPDYVLIYIGINDVINDRFFTPLDKYVENVTAMVHRAAKGWDQTRTLHHAPLRRGRNLQVPSEGQIRR